MFISHPYMLKCCISLQDIGICQTDLGFEQQAPYLNIKPFLPFLKYFFQAIEGVEKVVINMGRI
jgi:hypothetical protein